MLGLGHEGSQFPSWGRWTRRWACFTPCLQGFLLAGSAVLLQMNCSSSPPSPAPTALSAWAFSKGKTHKTPTFFPVTLVFLLPRTHVIPFHCKHFVCRPEAPCELPCGLSPFLHLQAHPRCCLALLSTDSFSRLCLVQLLLCTVANCA